MLTEQCVSVHFFLLNASTSTSPFRGLENNVWRDMNSSMVIDAVLALCRPLLRLSAYRHVCVHHLCFLNRSLQQRNSGSHDELEGHRVVTFSAGQCSKNEVYLLPNSSMKKWRHCTFLYSMRNSLSSLRQAVSIGFKVQTPFQEYFP